MLFPISYLATRYKIIENDQGKIGNQVLRNLILAGLITLGYGFIVSGIGLIFFGKIQIENPFLMGFLFFLISLSIYPIKSYLDKFIKPDFEILPDSSKNRLIAFRSDLKELVKLDDIVNLLRLEIQEVVQSQYVHIFLFDSNTNLYKATFFGNQRSSDLVFDQNSGLVKYLLNETKGQYFDDRGIIPSLIKPDLNSYSIVGSQIVYSNPGAKTALGLGSIVELVGWGIFFCG